jgi:hypothetical protein
VIRECDMSENDRRPNFLVVNKCAFCVSLRAIIRDSLGGRATQNSATTFQRLSRTNGRRDFRGAGPTHRKPDNALITATGDFALADVVWCESCDAV